MNTSVHTVISVHEKQKLVEEVIKRTSTPLIV